MGVDRGQASSFARMASMRHLYRRLIVCYDYEEKSSWIGLPPSLAGRLLSERNLPLTFRIQLFAGPGVQIGAPHYLGWSGSVSEAGKVSISSRLGSLLHIPEGASVVITPLSSVSEAKTVTLEPASSDDWEVVELNAEYIESRLLENCGVVSAHRSLPIWIQGQMVALKVTSTDPQQEVVRLAAGTEILVAPRPRVTNRNSIMHNRDGKDLPIFLRVFVTDDTPDIDMQDGPTVYISSITLKKLQINHDIKEKSIIGINSGGKFKSDMLARIEVMENLPNGHAVFPKTFESMLKRYAIRKFHHVRINPLNLESFPSLFMETFLKRSNSLPLPATRAPSDSGLNEACKRMPCNNDILEDCLRLSLPILSSKCRSILQHWGVPRKGGILLEGPQGSGKTAVMKSLCHILTSDRDILAATKYIDCRCVVSPKSFFSMLNYSFSWSAKNAPAVLVLDNLDIALTQTSQDEAGHEIPQDPDVTQLVRILSEGMDAVTKSSEKWMPVDSSGTNGCGNWPPIMFLGTCTQASKLPKCLRAMGRFDTVIRLKSPDLDSRLAMLAGGIKERDATVSSSDLAKIGPDIDGFDASDIDVLVERIISETFKRTLAENWMSGNDPNTINFPLQVSLHDIKASLDGMVPAAMWGSRTKKNIQSGIEGWADVGGMETIKEALQESLELPLLHPELIASSPLRLQTGALLYGPPGCGKTHIVAAAVAAADIRCIVVNGPELLNKYIGASEAAVRDVFQRASVAAPCVLFFDEFDAIAPKRGHDNTGVSDRVVNQLLTELDGVEGLKGVVVIGATSRPDLIDAALLRPGRLDKLLYCGFPEEEDRLAILQSLSRKSKLSNDVDIAELAKATEGFSGADLGALLADAQLAAAHEALEYAPQDKSIDSLSITYDHIQSSLSQVRPSVGQAEKMRLEAIYTRFRDGSREIHPTDIGTKITYA